MGIDIGKNSFHIVGLDRRGAIMLRQKWSRGQIEARLANVPPCLIGMEACVGAHHLSRKLQAHAHHARLMPRNVCAHIPKGRKTISATPRRSLRVIGSAASPGSLIRAASEDAQQLAHCEPHARRRRVAGADDLGALPCSERLTTAGNSPSTSRSSCPLQNMTSGWVAGTNSTHRFDAMC
jgi:transposase